MSNNAARFSNRKAKKVVGESSHQPKSKFIEERHTTRLAPLVPKTNSQKSLHKALDTCDLILCSGFAGVGKTYYNCTYAANLLLKDEIKHIVLIRPYQPLANRTVGFLKGSCEEKLTPYMLQMLNYIKDVVGAGAFEIMKADGRIVLQLLESVRGMDFKDAFILVDEAQLLTPPEVQALVTRIGKGSQIVFCGDSNQADNRNKQDGLSYLKTILAKYDIRNSAVINFTKEDCQREDIVYDFLCAFEEEGWL